jgi:hypothetical protein
MKKENVTTIMIVIKGVNRSNRLFRTTEPVNLRKKGYKIMNPLNNDRKVVSVAVSLINNGKANNLFAGWKNRKCLKIKKVATAIQIIDAGIKKRRFPFSYKRLYKIYNPIYTCVKDPAI